MQKNTHNCNNTVYSYCKMSIGYCKTYISKEIGIKKFAHQSFFPAADTASDNTQIRKYHLEIFNLCSPVMLEIHIAAIM